MKKHCRKHKKCKQKTITIIYKTDAQKAENNVIPESPSKIGFWKAVGLIIINKEPKTGQTTAFLLACDLGYIYNAFALLGSITLAIFLKVVFFDLDWSAGLQKNIVQSIAVAILLSGIAIISLIFRAMANDIKAEKDRNYIANLFFGFAGFASLIVAMLSLFKEVG